MINNNLTYISLFSSAGVGCYGFKKAGYKCIATNELIERRMNIQKINKKCDFETGYIVGDIKDVNTKNRIFQEIEKWNKLGNDKVDVLISTPPCQGMSVANHKKADDEIVRNSLVVESIKIINEINPKVFIFENVPAFMKTGCTNLNGEIEEIGEVIRKELGQNYIIYSRILNFKNYGSNSSRTRTLVIGIEKKYQDIISPIELFPNYCEEKKLKEVIGALPKLEWGEFDNNDFYHQFRVYPEHMRKWIHNLKEGQSAFDNKNIEEIPHKVVDGEIIINQNKNGDKYTRQIWNKVAPCIHTRNDLLASQNTVHPEQDRVFSIRELMKMMTIPDEFKWIDKDINELNRLTYTEKLKVLKSEEVNIRQSIGEAVPTNIFYQIASKIKENFLKKTLNIKDVKKIIVDYKLDEVENLKEYIKNSIYSYSTLAQIAELANSQREQNSAYFTNKFIINEIIKELPEFNKDVISIIEPSVGVGNFIPFIIKKYEELREINIDVVDIDNNNLEILKLLLEKIDVPNNVKINYIHKDFLLYEAEKKYDLCIGNPPFTKMKSNDKLTKRYLKQSINKESLNLVAFFWEKCMKISDVIALVSPKALLNVPEYKVTRDLINENNIKAIIDNGELGFKGVLVETICVVVDKIDKNKYTKIKSLPMNFEENQLQKYITDDEYPYWIIYRNNDFDKVAQKMEFNIFNVFRDRQITNKHIFNQRYRDTDVQVIKSRNIDDLGKNILKKENYDSFIEKEKLKEFATSKYLNAANVYITPNMTYNPRVMRKPNGVITNGSVAVLIPKDEDILLTDKELEYFSSDEYRKFYKIARNYQTRSLNIDSNSVFFFGKNKEF